MHAHIPHLTGTHPAAEEPIRISAPQADWPQRYRLEAQRIRQALQRHALPWVRQEHFGSTSVPGLAAKPIIDIMLLPPPDCDWRRLRLALEEIGYRHRQDNPAPRRMFLIKRSGQVRTHHVHVLTLSEAQKHLMFRDYLRRHPGDAEAYGRLKQSLARRHAFNLDAYTRGKDAFFASIVSQAQSAACSHGPEQGGPIGMPPLPGLPTWAQRPVNGGRQ